MVDKDLNLKVTAEFEGFGDVDAEKRTLDTEVAETIDALIKTNLRNRYEDIDDTSGIYIVGMEPPNVAVIERDE